MSQISKCICLKLQNVSDDEEVAHFCFPPLQRTDVSFLSLLLHLFLSPPSPLCPSHLYYTQNKIYLFRATLMNFLQNIQHWTDENLQNISLLTFSFSTLVSLFSASLVKQQLWYTSYISCFCILIQNIYKADILHFDFKYQHWSEKIDRKIKHGSKYKL